MSAEKLVKVNIPNNKFRLELPDEKTGGCSILMVGSTRSGKSTALKHILDKYFKGNVKNLPNGNTYWYIKNKEPFLTITGHDDGKGNGLKANIGILKELQKIDDYLKYQEVYDEVMRAYIVDNNLTTTNKFWMFDKLPNQLHSSELGIQTSGQQQPVSESLRLKNYFK